MSLVETNIHWLRQALALLEQVDDRSYTTSPAGMAPHRAGGHLRHVLEFYECFLDGLDADFVDYDSRRRDEQVERSRRAAGSRILKLIERLAEIPRTDLDESVRVRMEDSEGDAPLLLSSVHRELQALSSHTIHHFALIAMTLRLHGVETPPAFGMAPSTLRYLNNQRAA